MDRFKSEDKKRGFEYLFKVYDTTGNKAKEVIFYSKNTLQLYSTDLYIALEKFSRVSYFENGEITVLFFPEYYKEENRSIPVKYSMTVYENGNYKYSKDLLPPAYQKIIKEYENKYKQLTILKRH